MSLPLFVLYGSATGNAETIAKDLAAAFKASMSTSIYTDVVCCTLDEYKKKCAKAWEVDPADGKKYGVLVISSTTGNGDSPENAGRFVRMIKKKPKPDEQLLFRHCSFAILGLGDTNYDKFCIVGKTLDKQLEVWGGTRARPLACADEAVGLEDVVEPWKDTIAKIIRTACLPPSSPTKSPPISPAHTISNFASVDSDGIALPPAAPTSSSCDGVSQVLAHADTIMNE
jgi:sulfite reductase alpha subunit-like flavoprotein